MENKDTYRYCFLTGNRADGSETIKKETGRGGGSES